MTTLTADEIADRVAAFDRHADTILEMLIGLGYIADYTANLTEGRATFEIRGWAQ